MCVTKKKKKKKKNAKIPKKGGRGGGGGGGGGNLAKAMRYTVCLAVTHLSFPSPSPSSHDVEVNYVTCGFTCHFFFLLVFKLYAYVFTCHK